MIERQSSQLRFDLRYLYLVALAILIIGYVAVFRPLDDAIRSAHDAADADRITATVNIRLTRERRKLADELPRLERGMQGIDLHSDRTTIVAEFVRDVDTITAHEGVRITDLEAQRNAAAPAASVTPMAAPPSSTPPAPAAAPVGAALPVKTIAVPVALEPIPLQLTLQGGYLPTLRTLQRLSQIHVLAQVDISSLTRVHGVRHGASPDLITVMQLTLYRMLAHPPSALPAANGVLNAGTRPT